MVCYENLVIIFIYILLRKKFFDGMLIFICLIVIYEKFFGFKRGLKYDVFLNLC